MNENFPVLLKSFCILFFSALIIPVETFSQGALDSITEKDTREILGYLSSDKLKGRVDFSNGQLQAAEYISNTFERYRLEPYQGATGYYHPFATFDDFKKKLTPNNIIWNGRKLPEAQFYYSHFLPEIKKLNLEHFRVVEVKDTLHPHIVSAYMKDSIPMLVWFGEAAVIDSTAKHCLFMLQEVRHKKILIVRHPQPPQKLSIEADKEYKSNVLFNIAGKITGTSKAREIVIFSAHYDHISKSPDGHTGHFNGANDNASGVTALLQLAKYFSITGPRERTLLFIAFSGEERGLLGSRVFAEQVNPDRIACVVNIEMIGRNTAAGKNAFYVTGQDKSNLAEILAGNLEGTGVGIVNEPREKRDLFMRSDNYPFYRKKIPAHSIMCSDDDEPCYHQPCDDAGTIDFPNMTTIIRSIAIAVGVLVDGIQTPVLR